MSSPTAELALYLNHKANGYFLPYVISWDRSTLKIKWHGNEKNLHAYYIYLVVWLGMVMLPCNLCAIVLAFCNPGIVSIGQGMILVLNFVGILLIFLEDYLYIFHGFDITNALNTALQLELKSGSRKMEKGTPVIVVTGY